MFLSYEVRAAYVTQLYDSSMPQTVEALEAEYEKACRKNAEHLTPQPPRNNKMPGPPW
jgi:hypothetical protein